MTGSGKAGPTRSAGRLLLLLAALGACASKPPAATEAAALRGCWIERRGDNTITQRWFPARGADAGAWQGDELTYFQAGDPDPVRWMLKPGGEAAPWSMCMVELNMMTSPPCWRAFFGPGGPDGDNTQWVEIDAQPETLKITYVTGESRAVTYDGRRDGCD